MSALAKILLSCLLRTSTLAWIFTFLSTAPYGRHPMPCTMPFHYFLQLCIYTHTQNIANSDILCSNHELHNFSSCWKNTQISASRTFWLLYSWPKSRKSPKGSLQTLDLGPEDRSGPKDPRTGDSRTQSLEGCMCRFVAVKIQLYIY